MSFEETYAALRRIAQAAMRRDRPSHTLQPTALVHEFLMGLPDGFTASPVRNVEIVRIAGYRMRQILIDYARHRARHHPDSVADKRVSLEAVDGDDMAVNFPDLALLDDLLRELQKEQPEAAAVVEMRFFCGLKYSEIAKALGVAEVTAQRRWQEAKEWIKKRMGTG